MRVEPRDGINTLLRETRGSSLTPSAWQGCNLHVCCPEQGPHLTTLGLLSLDFHPLEL